SCWSFVAICVCDSGLRASVILKKWSTSAWAATGCGWGQTRARRLSTRFGTGLRLAAIKNASLVKCCLKSFIVENYGRPPLTLRQLVSVFMVGEKWLLIVPLQ